MGGIKPECTGKLSYEKQHKAIAVQRRLRKRKNNPQFVDVYKCPFCHKFHLSGRKLKRHRQK
jgi:hypothetical protein